MSITFEAAIDVHIVGLDYSASYVMGGIIDLYIRLSHSDLVYLGRVKVRFEV